MFFFLKFVSFFLILLPVLVNIAFITLLERKVLGYAQSRVGPSKVGWGGLLQPGADAVKLFLKQLETPTGANWVYFMGAPVLMLFLVMTIWGLMVLQSGFHYFSFSGILFLVILSLGVYPLLLAGWSSNSGYASMGGLRGVAQTISYEISLALILLILYYLAFTFSLKELNWFNYFSSVILIVCPLLMVWVVSALAETNRTPFDFSEGESELVSGFNVEYSSGGFAILFMAEYGMIFFMGVLTYVFFINISGLIAEMLLWGGLFVYLWIWVRATFPRFRYDYLMSLAWKEILPFTLSSLGLVLVLGQLFF